MTKWILAALVAGGVGLGVRAATTTAQDPDEQLAAHIEDLCEIARDNGETPVRGVRRLGSYLASNTDGILGSFGGTIQEIERIPDDDAHDERAYLARERILEPLIGCIADWDRFGKAIENDPEASALLEHALVRLDRTLEIIFGEGAVDVRALPQQLIQRLTGS